MKALLTTILLLAGIGMAAWAQDARHPKVMCELTYMTPQAYPARSLTPDYTLELRNDSAIVHLPYIGQVYTPVLDNEGYNFAEPYRDFSVNPTKKHDGTVYDFAISRNIVAYRFLLTLYADHSLSLTMLPTNAQSCSYEGTWSEKQ